MSDLAVFQRDFAGALIDDTMAGGLFADPAFAVYRNTWRKAAADALAASYPVVAELVGGRAFATLAAQHYRRHPPISSRLTEYGAELAAMIGQTPLAGHLPYLADVARLEWTIARVRHAADETGLSRANVPGKDGAAIGACRFRLVSAAALERFDHPAVTIWKAHDAPDRPIAIAPEWKEECALIARHDGAVRVQGIESSLWEALSSLATGERLGPVIADLAADRPGTDTAKLLATVMKSGAFTPRTEGEDDAD